MILKYYMFVNMRPTTCWFCSIPCAISSTLQCPRCVHIIARVTGEGGERVLASGGQGEGPQAGACQAHTLDWNMTDMARYETHSQ